MRSANTQSASCHTLSMVGELSMSKKGAPNWFHDVSQPRMENLLNIEGKKNH